MTEDLSVLSIPNRIRQLYSSCTEEEQHYLKKILSELSVSGYSKTYNDIWLADYKEIPVNIDTFVESDMYLGRITRNGNAIYPFWRKVLTEIFSAGNRFEECFFTGATRIGKSSTAITCVSYMLYRLMCLRDPQKFFDKKEVSKFSILFFNITKDLASGVAFREFNDSVVESPWFMEHGAKSKSERNFYYIPEGGKVIIDYGSDSSHSLGQQVFCLTGNTQILTDTGYLSLSELSGRTVQVGQLSYDNTIEYVTADVVLTKYTNDIVRVTLEDGSVIEGTADHPVMLSDGTYKKLGELSNLDDLLTLNTDEVDQMNLKNSSDKYIFCVYMHISPSNKRYVGITSKSVSERWGKGGSGYKDNKHFWSAIKKYGWDNFIHEILATNLTLDEACEIESKLICEFDLMNPDKGYNQTSGGQHSTPSEETRQKLRDSTTKNWNRPEFRNAVVSSLKGHVVSETTKVKISEAKQGASLGPSPLAGRSLSEEHKAKLRGRVPWNFGHTKYDDARIQAYSEKLNGKVRDSSHCDNIAKSRKFQYDQGYSPVWITNGVIETTIDQSTQSIPDGYVLGRLSRGKYMNKDGKCKQVAENMVRSYLANGWSLGRGRCDKISQARKKYIWSIDGNEYDNAQAVADYLHTIGYPDIVSSTITSLSSKGFDSSKKYRSLSGRLLRRSIDEDK